MPPTTAPNLTARPVGLTSPELREIRSWAYPAQPFFVAQIRRFLDTDIPQRLLYGATARGWDRTTLFTYRDPAAGGELVGFGTLSQERVYQQFTNGKRHYYIPVLSVRPGRDGKGYGQAIVEHLVESAVVGRLFSPAALVDDRVFLDVYAANAPACGLYTRKCGFRVLNPANPITDPDENNEPYLVMARNIRLVVPPRPARPVRLSQPVLPSVMPPESVTFTSDDVGEPDDR